MSPFFSFFPLAFFLFFVPVPVSSREGLRQDAPEPPALAATATSSQKRTEPEPRTFLPLTLRASGASGGRIFRHSSI